MSDENRPLTQEELDKIAAETAKIVVETAKFRAETEDIVDQIARARQETEVILRKADLEYRILEADAKESENRLAVSAIDLAGKQRIEDEELARNKHNFIYYFTGSVNESSVYNCTNELTRWSRIAPGHSIEIMFSSPGGSVVDGMVLFDVIQDLRRKGHRVTTSTLGMAASMAGILLQAGDVRVMHREAWVLIHEISFGASGKVGEIEDTVAWVKRIQERVLDIFAERCKKAGENGTAKKPLTKSQIKTHWTRQDWWLSSDDCLMYGLVDVLT